MARFHTQHKDDTARLVHVAYCGMVGIPRRNTLTELRQVTAWRIHHYRRLGFSVAILQRGRAWEIQERNGDCMISASCGDLHLDPSCEERAEKLEAIADAQFAEDTATFESERKLS